MYIAMNRFKIQFGSEETFENVWKSRESRLAEVPGFVEFHLLRGAQNEDEKYTLYASHTVWSTQADFTAWTQSEHFRAAHHKAGDSKPSYIGHPQFEGFSVVEGA